MKLVKLFLKKILIYVLLSANLAKLNLLLDSTNLNVLLVRKIIMKLSKLKIKYDLKSMYQKYIGVQNYQTREIELLLLT